MGGFGDWGLEITQAQQQRPGHRSHQAAVARPHFGLPFQVRLDPHFRLEAIRVAGDCVALLQAQHRDVQKIQRRQRLAGQHPQAADRRLRVGDKVLVAQQHGARRVCRAQEQRRGAPGQRGLPGRGSRQKSWIGGIGKILFDALVRERDRPAVPDKMDDLQVY